MGVDGQAILIPRALKAREILPARLGQAGAKVSVVTVYQNKRPEGTYETLRAKLANKDVDIVTFTSSSTVTNFIDMIGVKDKQELQELMRGIKIAAIGPVTGKTIEENGLKVDIQPQTYTIPDLVDAIVKDARSA